MLSKTKQNRIFYMLYIRSLAAARFALSSSENKTEIPACPLPKDCVVQAAFEQ
jgi:hypothetical protein